MARFASVYTVYTMEIAALTLHSALAVYRSSSVAYVKPTILPTGATLRCCKAVLGTGRGAGKSHVDLADKFSDLVL